MVFDADLLRLKLRPTLEQLFHTTPESIPFREPVDPLVLNIPDYPNLVKHPMDLATIKRKLDAGSYEDPWGYVNDVWLMFENAWLYNRRTSHVYRYSTKLSEVFESVIDPAMQALGLCCGRKYAFNTHALYCYGKELCVVPRDAKYYSYENRYYYCLKCFNKTPEDTITFTDDATKTIMVIPKKEFTIMCNNHIDEEPFVACACGRKFHQVCVRYLNTSTPPKKPTPYICDHCHKKHGIVPMKNTYTALRLPKTKLDDYIEQRLQGFLRRKRVNVNVHIRVVSSANHHVDVKPGMKAKFVTTGKLQARYPYRAKAIFAFEEIDGADVCFFAINVQEYGSDCPHPNNKRVYIAYLDSVHYFQPRELRTDVYHEILISYLAYVKNLGFTMAHIWACPPSEGDDYIFHSHPRDQKTPKPKRMQDWYKKMLGKAKKERIVHDFRNMLQQAVQDHITSPADIPYFDGDFWPNIIEEAIKDIEDRSEADCVPSLNKDIKKRKQPLKAKINQRKSIKKITIQSDDVLSSKIFTIMEKHKNVFFVVHLCSPREATMKKQQTIKDPDPLVPCELMDGRDGFINLARENNLEFSSLRRAKYSTLALLYELHNNAIDKFLYTCDNCNILDICLFHCIVCVDYDMCMSCLEKNGHGHEMIKIPTSREKEPTQLKADQKAECPLPCEQYIQTLKALHKSKSNECYLLNYKKKIYAIHSDKCNLQLRVHCALHMDIDRERMQQQLGQRLRQAQMMNRRVASMNDAPSTSDPTPQGVVKEVACGSRPQNVAHQPMVGGHVPPTSNALQLPSTSTQQSLVPFGQRLPAGMMNPDRNDVTFNNSVTVDQQLGLVRRSPAKRLKLDASYIAAMLKGYSSILPPHSQIQVNWRTWISLNRNATPPSESNMIQSVPLEPRKRPENVTDNRLMSFRPGEVLPLPLPPPSDVLVGRVMGESGETAPLRSHVQQQAPE